MIGIKFTNQHHHDFHVGLFTKNTENNIVPIKNNPTIAPKYQGRLIKNIKTTK